MTKAIEETTVRIERDLLEQYLSASIQGFTKLDSIQKFSEGQSNPTFKVVTESKSFVIRCKPEGDLLPSAHAVEREYTVLNALNQTDFPVPRVYSLCSDTSILGSNFYVMEYVPGKVYWNFATPGESPRDRRALFASMCSTLAKLHSFSVDDLGLSEFGVRGNYFSRQIARWSKQYMLSATGNLKQMDQLIDWLPSNVPEDNTTCLVHGDFSLHNILFDHRKKSVAAVIDWELSTIGHPLGDLFYNALAWYRPDGNFQGERCLVDKTTPSSGIPALEEYLQIYCEEAGLKTIENPHFHKAYNLFRLASILQGIVGRVKSGNANDSSANTLQLNQRIQLIADVGWKEAQLGGAV